MRALLVIAADAENTAIESMAKMPIAITEESRVNPLFAERAP
jgi:hypothetical protein